MRPPFIRPPSHVLHPLFEKIILLAPDRTCVLAVLGVWSRGLMGWIDDESFWL
ncbi:hypothetical protein S101468_03090 (plasmid) [Acetobacter pasteurianus subsp. pasteurianus]|uniref:Uncharacterized protein n=1 Tax=Acetobacter pasteurianus subsp. pasteurianus TaxID=481145 RepID=A0AAC9SW05_ACEPA|nr:hypothetical protein S101468_03090 [Acetobacter pasteurianus subsp. pasteurianus]